MPKEPIPTIMTPLLDTPHLKRRRSPDTTSIKETDPVVLKTVLEDLRRYTDELGSDHIKVADAWNALGLIRLHMQGDTLSAVECHEEALRIYRSGPTEGMQVAVTLNDLGACYERAQDVERALEVYQEALSLMKEAEVSRKNRILASTERAVARLLRS